MFTIYVCPECHAIEAEPSAAQHGCRERCGMWVPTSVIETKAHTRLQRDYEPGTR